MINDTDRQIFEKNLELYNMLMKHSFIRNYTKETYTELITLYSKYINDKHNFSHWCSSCRTELVNHLYSWYQKEKDSEVQIQKVTEVQIPKVTNEVQVVLKKRRKK